MAKKKATIKGSAGKSSTSKASAGGSTASKKPVTKKAPGKKTAKKAATKSTGPVTKKVTKKAAKKVAAKAAPKASATAAKKVVKKTAKKVAKKVAKVARATQQTTKKTAKEVAKKVSKKIAKKAAGKKVVKTTSVRDAAQDVVKAAKAVARVAGEKAAQLSDQARDPQVRSAVKKKTKKVMRRAAAAVSDAAQRVSAAAESASGKGAGSRGSKKVVKKVAKKVVKAPSQSAQRSAANSSAGVGADADGSGAAQASSGPELGSKPVRRKVIRRGNNTPSVSDSEQNTAQPSRSAGSEPVGVDAAADSGERKRRKRKRRRGRGKGEPGDAGPGADGGRAEPERDEARDEDVPRSKRRRSTAAPEPGELDRWDEIFEKQTFADLGLRGSVLRGIEACGFKYPTKIQSQLIPLMVAGEDVLGQSRTGTGKTAAFGLPLFQNAERGKPFQTIILAPTRELAIQIGDELRDLGRFTPIRVGVVYGGQKMNQQQKALETGPEIIVATPGRLMDVHQRGWLHFHDVKTVVLDEVDRMLDIGFRDDIREILSRMRGEHQTVLVSATISEEIERLARKFMRKDVKRLETVGTSLTVSLVQQHYVSVMPWDKMRMLHYLLTHEEPTMTLVFCNMKRTVDKITQFLRKKGLDAEAIHGDLPQGMRNAIMRKLHDGNLHMLICSDLAARGLDVEGVSHVVNYDLPEDPEVYIHRVGRTARAGRDGVAWALVTPADGHLLTQIEMLANIHIPEKKMPDFQPGPEPEHIVADRAAQERRLEQVRTAKNRFASSTSNAASLSKAAVSSGRANPFPTGPIPTKLPPRKLGGKIKTARSMKESTPPGLSAGGD